MAEPRSETLLLVTVSHKSLKLSFFLFAGFLHVMNLERHKRTDHIGIFLSCKVGITTNHLYTDLAFRIFFVYFTYLLRGKSTSLLYVNLQRTGKKSEELLCTLFEIWLVPGLRLRFGSWVYSYRSVLTGHVSGILLKGRISLVEIPMVPP